MSKREPRRPSDLDAKAITALPEVQNMRPGRDLSLSFGQASELSFPSDRELLEEIVELKRSRLFAFENCLDDPVTMRAPIAAPVPDDEPPAILVMS